MIYGKRVGAVILNYKTKEMTEKLVSKCSKYKFFDYICIVDNDSGDEFYCDKKSKKIILIKNDANLGYAAGNNVGLKILVNDYNCDYVFVMNPDIKFSFNAIRSILKYAVRHKDAGIVSCVEENSFYSRLGRIYLDSPTVKSVLADCFFSSRRFLKYLDHRKKVKRIQKKAPSPCNVDAVLGSFFCVKSDFLRRAGFLYDEIFMYGEEVFFGVQCRQNGYKVILLTDTFFSHCHDRSAFENKKAFRFQMNSALRFLRSYRIGTPLYLLLSIFVNFSVFEYDLICGLWNFVRGCRA